MNLFQLGDFTLHSGERTDWKIECDALTDADIETLASIIGANFDFYAVEGVPTGGLRLAKALEPYVDPESEGLLIVDDVLTTGASMEEQRAGRDAAGIVIFARGNNIPRWIWPMFRFERGYWG